MERYWSMRRRPRRKGNRSSRTKKIVAGISAGALLILLAYVVLVIPETNNFHPAQWTVSEHPETEISSSYTKSGTTQTWELKFLSPIDYSATVDFNDIELPIVAGILWEYIPDPLRPAVHDVEIWQLGNPVPIKGYVEFAIAEEDVLLDHLRRDIHAVGLFATEPISDIYKIVWTITT